MKIKLPDIYIDLEAFSMARYGKENLYQLAQQELDGTDFERYEIQDMNLYPIKIIQPDTVTHYCQIKTVQDSETYKEYEAVQRDGYRVFDRQIGFGKSNDYCSIKFGYESFTFQVNWQAKINNNSSDVFVGVEKAFDLTIKQIKFGMVGYSAQHCWAALTCNLAMFVSWYKCHVEIINDLAQRLHK